jgi:hypothetical protein
MTATTTTATTTTATTATTTRLDWNEDSFGGGQMTQLQRS